MINLKFFHRYLYQKITKVVIAIKNQSTISAAGFSVLEENIEYVFKTEPDEFTKILLIKLFAKCKPNANSKPSSSNVKQPINKAKKT